MNNKTTTPTKKNIEVKWHLFDADGKILGRLATEAAKILIGKNKASFTNNINVGDKVVIINSDKIEVTGKKKDDKEYIWHTGYPGGLRSKKLKDVLAKDATKVLESAIKGMLPKNKLLSERMRNLYIYKGTEHPHQAQVKLMEKK